MVGPVLFNSTKLADVFDRSDLALTCIDCIQRNGKWCFGWEPMIWSLYCMYLINHSRVSVSPFEKGDNHKLIHHLTMIDDSHYMQWWGMIATYSPFIATSSLYTYIKWYMQRIFGHVFFWDVPHLHQKFFREFPGRLTGNFPAWTSEETKDIDGPRQGPSPTLSCCLPAGWLLESAIEKKQKSMEIRDFIWRFYTRTLEWYPNPCFGGLTPVYPHFNTISRDF